MPRARCALSATVATLLLVPACAHASTVSVTIEAPSVENRSGISKGEYVAAPGEANDLSVRADGGALVFRDSGAVVRATGRCSSIDEHTARCDPTHRAQFGDGRTVASLSYLRVDGGDGNDRLQFVLPEVSGFDQASVQNLDVSAGAGDDTLDGSGFAGALLVMEGGPGDDELTGSAGVDSLTGDAGRDRLAGGEGDDSLSGDNYSVPAAQRARDVVDGGPGRDKAHYVGDLPVVVDLSEPSGGEGSPRRG